MQTRLRTDSFVASSEFSSTYLSVRLRRPLLGALLSARNRIRWERII